MSIAAFPSSLQPIIQQGFLARRFMNGLESVMGFRAIADREEFPNKIGQTITMTRKGLKSPVTTPLAPTTNTNFDNGLTPSTWSVEQYTLGLNMYGDTIDLNMVSEGVGIASQFLANAETNGIQAMQSLDRIARNTLFYGSAYNTGGYLSGNTRVITALSAAGTTVHVDDITGFMNLFNPAGQIVPITAALPQSVVFNGGDIYLLVGAAADATNVSTAPGGQSGTLTFSTNVSQADGAAGNSVVAATAPLVVRPNSRQSTAALVAPSGTYGAANYVPGDMLGIQNVLAAVAVLRSNNVPTINGFYNCYLDNMQLLGLFKDADFKYLYRGAYGSETYAEGQVIELLGVRFIPTTEAPQQASLGAGPIHRAIVCGKGALVEGDFASIGANDLPGDMGAGEIEIIDRIAMVTREPLDRLRQIIAQSWYWVGGFALPTDVTATTAIIPTATASYLKRAVVIESL